jgi:prevent-host-death family protein
LARILTTSETLPLSSVKARFSELVGRVEREQDRVVITRNGIPAAVLVGADDLESLEETLEVMSAPELVAQMRESQEAFERGEEGMTLEELRASLGHKPAA